MVYRSVDCTLGSYAPPYNGIRSFDNVNCGLCYSQLRLHSAPDCIDKPWIFKVSDPSALRLQPAHFESLPQFHEGPLSASPQPQAPWPRRPDTRSRCPSATQAHLNRDPARSNNRRSNLQHHSQPPDSASRRIARPSTTDTSTAAAMQSSAAQASPTSSQRWSHTPSEG